MNYELFIIFNKMNDDLVPQLKNMKLYDTFQEQRPIWVPWGSKFKVCYFGLAMTSFVWNGALKHLSA